MLDDSKGSSKSAEAAPRTPSSIFGSRKLASNIDDRKSPEVERRSPLPKPSSSSDKLKSSGLSCLSSATLDEDKEPNKPSPEKRALSSSIHSLSDMLGSKLTPTGPKDTSTTPSKALSPGISPFASRKTDSELVTARRKSFNPDESEAVTGSPDDGKKTPEGVVKR